MRGDEDERVGVGHRLRKRPAQRPLELLDVRIVDRRRKPAIAEEGVDVDRRTLAGVVNVGFVGRPQQRDFAAACRLDQLADPAYDAMRHALVDAASRLHELGDERVCVGKEVWVHGDAVAAYPGPGPQDIDSRMLVGDRDRLPDVDVELFGDDRQLVGERDVDVTVRVLDDLYELRSVGQRDRNRALAKR